MKRLGITKIQLGSSIAAYYNPEGEKRTVIYQDADSKNLYEYGVNDESCKFSVILPVATSHLSLSLLADHLRNSTDARNGTAVAVTYAFEQVFVYYTDEQFEVRRIVKKKGEWGPSIGVDGAPPLDPSSLLTVTTSSDKVNHLFYLQPDSPGEFTHIRDEINS